MVLSLRAAEQQRVAEERRNRLIMARQYGSMLGVESARYYQKAKEAQTAAVRSAVRAKCGDDRAGRAADVASHVVMAERRRGEAMRSAADLVERVGQRGQEEMDAWGAERRLEQMRSDLAADRLAKANHERAVAAQERAARRDGVRAMEADRTNAVLARARAPDPVDKIALGGTTSADGSAVGPPHGAVTMRAADPSMEERAADAAPSYQAAREEQRRQQAARVQGVRKDAQKRASEAVMQKRHDDMLKQQEAARAAALQKELIAAAQKRSGRPGFAEFQEEEARRAQRINHQAHLEFERVFLATDGWTVRDVQRAAAAEAVPDQDGSAVLFDTTRIRHAADLMLQCAYPLPCRPVLSAELTTPRREAPGHSGAAAAAGGNDDAAAGEDVPTPSERPPVPLPSTHRSPQSPPDDAYDVDEDALATPSDEDDDA